MKRILCSLLVVDPLSDSARTGAREDYTAPLQASKLITTNDVFV
jgi:hypothetical protein